MLQPHRSRDNTAHVHCITKDGRTHTHKHVILIAFPRQKWFRERALNATSYAPCLSCNGDQAGSLKEELNSLR
jgi:hypothetical protein